MIEGIGRVGALKVWPHNGASATPPMPRKNESTAVKVFIDPTVLAIVDETQPVGISRTGWVNYLIQQGAQRIRDRNG
jgi:hypothetical protein